MTDLLSHNQIANAILCLLLALHLILAQTRRKLPARILGLNYLLYVNQSLMLAAVLNGYVAPFQMMRPVFAMFLAPGLYLYFLSIKRRDSTITAKDLGHCLPALVVFILLLTSSPLLALLDFILFASYTVYLVMIAVSLAKGSRIFEHLGEYAIVAYRWLSMLVLLLFINVVLEIAIYMEIRKGTALVNSVSLLFGSSLFLLVNAITVFAALRRNPLFEWMYQFGESAIESYLPRPKDTQALEGLYKEWQDLVETETLYKREFGITLTQAAKKLQVPARQLSNAINCHYQSSFSKYLNDRRVEEAGRLLLANEEMPIIDVMFESGFSSKSNFNKEFQRMFGVSPSKFRAAKDREIVAAANLTSGK